MTPSPNAYELIIEDLYEGISLRESLKNRGVNRTSFYDFKDKNVAFADRYIRARHAQADLMVEQLIDIADDETIDPNRARNMISVRQWSASKIIPATYGERLDVNVAVTASIVDALSAARARALPMRDLMDVAELEVVESPMLSHDGITGSKPVLASDTNVLPDSQTEIDSIDILIS